MAGRMIEDEACVICHDEAQAVVTLADYLSYEGGGLIEAAACNPHLIPAFAYLVAVEAPRRGRVLEALPWAQGVLDSWPVTPPTPRPLP